jgi:hypothetical protein
MPNTHGNNRGEEGSEGRILNPRADDTVNHAMMLEMVNRLCDLEARLAEMQGSSSQRDSFASDKERAEVVNFTINMSVLNERARQVGTMEGQDGHPKILAQGNIDSTKK